MKISTPNKLPFELTTPAENDSVSLKRCLTAIDLILLGVGAVIGAGIFVLTGIAAATKAGPAIILSYFVAGTACAFSALSYAELAATLGGCGSAYGYARAGFGPTVGWFIGWALLLEYGISCAAVAVGWSGYVNALLHSLNIHLPHRLLHGPFEGGTFNLPAFFIVSFIALLLSVGAKTGARFNSIIVLIKLAAVALFLILASQHINFVHWHDFAPFGWKGIMEGAAFIFFAYVGFDAVSTAAEETINPQRNLPIGIIASLIACTLLYILVAGTLTLIAPYQTLNTDSPIADVLIQLGYGFGASFVAVGALAGLTTVILVMYYGLTRVILAMARDRLLPNAIAAVHPRTRTPLRIIFLAWLVIGFSCALIPIDELVSMVNIGTLTAFTVVCLGVIVLRYRQPQLERPFKVPFMPVTPILGALSCLYLIYSLPSTTWHYFAIWLMLGALVYLNYGRRNARAPT